MHRYSFHAKRLQILLTHRESLGFAITRSENALHSIGGQYGENYSLRNWPQIFQNQEAFDAIVPVLHLSSQIKIWCAVVQYLLATHDIAEPSDDAFCHACVDRFRSDAALASPFKSLGRFTGALIFHCRSNWILR